MPESSNSKIQIPDFKITIKAGKNQKHETENTKRETKNVKLKTLCAFPSRFLLRPETRELRSSEQKIPRRC